MTLSRPVFYLSALLGASALVLSSGCMWTTTIACPEYDVAPQNQTRIELQLPGSEPLTGSSLKLMIAGVQQGGVAKLQEVPSENYFACNNSSSGSQWYCYYGEISTRKLTIDIYLNDSVSSPSSVEVVLTSPSGASATAYTGSATSTTQYVAGDQCRGPYSYRKWTITEVKSSS